MPDRNGNELAAQNAGHYGIPPQGEGEDNAAFRSRVAGALRGMGKLIEAHESLSNRWHDEKDETGECPAEVGILGAVACAMQPEGSRIGRGPDEERNLGDDIAAGMLVRYGPTKEERERTADSLLMLINAMK